ncbi:hypothetical protein Mapa_002489 [Marchantia paleacea]|nr:hypothetical protein Mapa_002489 [Marchantia paleacea]
MTSLRAVISPGIPPVGHTDWRIDGALQKSAARVNLSASTYNANMYGLASSDVCRPTSGSGGLQRFFIPRAVDQSEVQTDKYHSSKEVDDNNAAENAAEIAEDTMQGVAREGSSRVQGYHLQDKGSGSVLEAVTDTASQAAQTMRSNLMKAGNLVAGSGANVTEDSQSSESTGTLERQDDPAGTVTEKLEGNMGAEDQTEVDRDSNNAAENAAEMGTETLTGLANARQKERGEDTTAQAEEFGHDFGDQARHFQDNVQEQAQGFVDSIKSGASRASEQVQAAGKDIMSRADHALGRSTDDDEENSNVLKLKPEDFQEAYIEIDDGSAKESILL